MSDWTVDTAHAHVRDMLAEQDRRLAVKLQCIDEAIARGEACVTDQKRLMVKLRDEAITREEYQLRHKALEDLHKSDVALIYSRIAGMDSKRDDIGARVIKIEARAGTIQVSLAMGILSALLSGGMFVFELVHPFAVR